MVIRLFEKLTLRLGAQACRETGSWGLPACEAYISYLNTRCSRHEGAATTPEFISIGISGAPDVRKGVKALLFTPENPSRPRPQPHSLFFEGEATSPYLEGATRSPRTSNKNLVAILMEISGVPGVLGGESARDFTDTAVLG